MGQETLEQLAATLPNDLAQYVDSGGQRGISKGNRGGRTDFGPCPHSSKFI